MKVQLKANHACRMADAKTNGTSEKIDIWMYTHLFIISESLYQLWHKKGHTFRRIGL